MPTHGAPNISVLDADPELAGKLAPADLEAARPHAAASVLTLPAGEFDPCSLDGMADGHLGFLVVSGLVARNVIVLGRTSIDLLGPEDLIRPWEDGTEAVSVPHQVNWSVLERTKLAVLDRRFALRIAPWPEIGAALLDRMFRRARWLSFHVAILENPRVDVRLVLLFWQLAERWGRVGPEGVTVPLPLTHHTLGRLIRAQRPSVTASLRHLAERRLIEREGAGAWLLRGDLSHQLHALR